MEVEGRRRKNVSWGGEGEEHVMEIFFLYEMFLCLSFIILWQVNSSFR